MKSYKLSRNVFLLTIILTILTACVSSEKVKNNISSGRAYENNKDIESLSVNGNVLLIDNNGNADIDITNTDFLNKGFSYGDSVDIEFDNGCKLEDVPFLSGMYVEYGKIMLYGKESKDKVSFIQKYKSFAENNNVNIQTTYTITLKEKSKYLNIENVGNLTYSKKFEDYNNEHKFSNFREVNVGDIKEGRLYRSASVIDNSENRAQYTSKLAIDNGIKTIINIINKQDEYSELLANIEGNSKILIENTIIINAPISNDYQSEKNIKIIIDGLNELINYDYPYLIHCLEGKDRTGYELAIIEALCNASYDEIVNDYMLTYDNYYGVNINNDIKKYNYIKESNIDAMLKFITNADDLNKIDYQDATKKFLISYGMNEDNINILINKLCK